MTCRLTAPSHYLNQCWPIISGVQWHSPETNFTGSVQNMNSWSEFEKYTYKTLPHLPGEWVNTLRHGHRWSLFCKRHFQMHFLGAKQATSHYLNQWWSPKTASDTDSVSISVRFNLLFLFQRCRARYQRVGFSGSDFILCTHLGYRSCCLVEKQVLEITTERAGHACRQKYWMVRWRLYHDR